MGGLVRDSVKQFVKICAENLPLLEPIYEFGSLQVPSQVGFADLRRFFPNKKYIGADMREGPGVNIILNLHAIDLPSESVGTVLILDTLEHVEFARKAIDEVYRILKPDGILIITSVMNFPIHDYPYDYWRFTPEAFRSLLKPFKSSLVDFAGEVSFPHTVVGVGFKDSIPDNIADDFRTKLKDWKCHWSNFSELPISAWKRWIKLIIPPIFLSIFQKIKRFCLNG